jgi:hypothetical protein
MKTMNQSKYHVNIHMTSTERPNYKNNKQVFFVSEPDYENLNKYILVFIM